MFINFKQARGGGVYSRAAFIRGQRLFEGGVYSSKYGVYIYIIYCSPNMKYFIKIIKRFLNF